MPRIYRPEQSEDDSPGPPTVLKGFIRLEVLGGALLMVLGGFVVRARGDYTLIVLGVTLAGLGLYRLTTSYNRRRSSTLLEDDRVLNKLKLHFDANYSIAVNYELPDGDVIPYLVVGPPGLLLLERWDHPGRFEEDNGTWRRDSDDDPFEVRDPREKNGERIRAVRTMLRSEGLKGTPIESLVVVTTPRAEGDPLETDEVVALRDLLKSVRDRTDDSPLNWEEVDELEEALGLGAE